jgi:hypothetical protein
MTETVPSSSKPGEASAPAATRPAVRGSEAARANPLARTTGLERGASRSIARPSAVEGHWERGHLIHTYWTGRGGTIKAAIIRLPGGVCDAGQHLWEVPAANLRGHSPTLETARREALAAWRSGFVQLEMVAPHTAGSVPDLPLNAALLAELDESIRHAAAGHTDHAIQSLRRARALAATSHSPLPNADAPVPIASIARHPTLHPLGPDLASATTPI